MTNSPKPGAKWRLDMYASECSSGTCPTVYGTDTDSVLVQGYIVTAEDAGLDLPAGEQIVEIPREILIAAAARATSKTY